MPDRVLAGEAPPSGAALEAYPPGSLWMQVIERASDATGKTIGLDIWCTNMPQLIGYNLAGPAYDMQGGPFIATQRPIAWTTAPSVSNGRQIPGKATVADFVIAQPNFYHFEVIAGSVHTHADVQVGKPGVAQMGRTIDSEKAQEATLAGRQAVARQQAYDMLRPSPIIGATRGRGSRSVRMPRRTP